MTVHAEQGATKIERVENRVIVTFTLANEYAAMMLFDKFAAEYNNGHLNIEVKR